MKESVESVLAAAKPDYKIPGVACAISMDNNPPVIFTSGQLSETIESPSVSRETYFDLASVTKIVTTYQWLLRLVSEGTVSLDDKLCVYLPQLTNWLADVPLSRLANHSSGLAAHQHYYWRLGEPLLKHGAFDRAKADILAQIIGGEPAYEPGECIVYSDLGYILLAEILSLRSQPLVSYWDTLYGHSEDTLHWCASQRTPPQTLRHSYAATEKCPWRKRHLSGEVHDDNCWTLGGASGHAGTFGRVTDVQGIGQQFLQSYLVLSNDLADHRDVMLESFDDRFRMDGFDRVLGWQTRTPGASSSGQFFSDSSFGHLGFTGTSLWIDPEAHVVVTILTNRVCPTRNNDSIKAFRPRLHDALRRHIEK